MAPGDGPQQILGRRRQPLRNGEAVEGRPNAGPAAPHRPGIVTAAAQDKTAPRRIADRRDRRPERVVGQSELALRIVGQGIGAALQNQDLGREVVDQRQHRRLHQEGQFAVVEVARHRQVARLPAGPVPEPAGGIAAALRPAPRLVDRQREDTRLVGEGILDAVAVMGVQVQVEDPADPAVEQPQDGQRRVVKIAEPAGLVRPPVMGAAGRAVKRRRPLQQQIGGQQGTAAGRRRAAEDLRKDRVAVAADVVALAGFRRDRAPALGLDQRRHVVRGVKAGKLIGRRLGAVQVDAVGQPAQGAAQVDAGRNPGDRQGVRAAIARQPIDLAADEARRGRRWRCRSGHPGWGLDRGIVEPRDKGLSCGTFSAVPGPPERPSGRDPARCRTRASSIPYMIASGRHGKRAFWRSWRPPRRSRDRGRPTPPDRGLPNRGLTGRPSARAPTAT